MNFIERHPLAAYGLGLLVSIVVSLSIIAVGAWIVIAIWRAVMV